MVHERNIVRNLIYKCVLPIELGVLLRHLSRRKNRSEMCTSVSLNLTEVTIPDVHRFIPNLGFRVAKGSGPTLSRR